MLQVRRVLTQSSNRLLLALVVLGDAFLIAVFLPLERYAIAAAADPSSSILLILALLAANLLLLCMVLAMMAASTALAARLVARTRFVRVVRGTIEASLGAGRESRSTLPPRASGPAGD